MSRQSLGEAASALFGRLAGGTLTDGDVLRPEDVPVQTPVGWIRHFVSQRRVEDDDARIMRIFTPEHGVLLDIGGYWGYLAASFRNAGATCPILSFEPMPAHHASLSELRRLDAAFDYSTLALGSREEQVTLYGPVVNGKAIMGLNSVGGRTFNSFGVDHLMSLHGGEIADAARYRVQFIATPLFTRRLDGLLGLEPGAIRAHWRFPATRVAAMKLDVEGHEPHVLTGARSVLERDRPFIMIESGNRNRAVVEQLQPLGYRYAERAGDQLVETSGHSQAPNGYWFHPDHIADYHSLGLR